MRPTWNPWNEDGNPNSADTNISDGNPAYFRDKLLYSDGTNKSTYNIGFKLDILPKKLVLNGNASLYRYDYMVENLIKRTNWRIKIQIQHVRLLWSRNVILNSNIMLH